MISAVNSTEQKQKQQQQQKTTQKQKQREVEFMAEIIAASFRTEAQKPALSEKCLQSLSPRTLPLATSMSGTNAEAKAGLQKQRQRKCANQKEVYANTRHEICRKIQGVTPAFFKRASRGFHVMGTLRESA